MATFSIEDFKSTIASTGLARENRFEVILPEFGSSGSPVSLFCKSATLPQLAILTKQQRLFGPPMTRAASIDYGGQGVQLTFYVDANMNVKKYFDDWMHRSINASSFTANYLADYAKDVWIYQLNDGEERVYEIRLVEAFPTASGPLNLDQGSNDTFHVFPVTLAYRYWETQEVNNSVFPDSVQSFTGPIDKLISFPRVPTPAGDAPLPTGLESAFAPTRPNEGF
jgi:hypothetical protein